MSDATTTTTTHYVAGELAMLVLRYMDAEGLQAPHTRRQLLPFGRGSQMPIRIWWQALAELEQLSQKPNLGFEIGQYVQLSDSGALGYLIAQNETLADALSCFQRFQSLLHSYGPVRVSHEPDKVRVTWDYQGKSSTLLSDQVFVASMMSVVRKITGQSALPVTEIGLPHPRPAVDTLPLALALEYQAEALYISFPPAALKLGITTSDPFLLGVMGRQSRALSARQQSPFRQGVESRILAALASGQPSAERIAADLGLSRRSLHRRLTAESLNFHQLLRDIRMSLADLYLQEADLSLTEVGFLLGYSEQSAFQRAFRHWHNQTPRQYRRQLGR